jgi:hypothetical protein
MKLNHQGIIVSVLFLIIGMLLGACSSGSYINVKYQIPPASNQLESRTVSLGFNDMRPDKTFLSEAAQKDFKNFSGLFSLYIARENQKDELIGGYNVEDLFTRALQKRLESMGVKIASQGTKDLPVMEITLENFSMDYKSRKWITTVSYQARLTKDKSRSANETVTITGERMKIIGRGSAEEYLGEIFTDSLNKLDLEKLFKQAGL